MRNIESFTHIIFVLDNGVCILELTCVILATILCATVAWSGGRMSATLRVLSLAVEMPTVQPVSNVYPYSKARNSEK
jgi:DTW domain-containing protein YfiP